LDQPQAARTPKEKEVVMADNEPTQATQAPGPDPALKRLEQFVGTWEVKGRTLEAEEDNVSGRLTFEWLPGGFFLQQRTELNFAGYEVKGLEVIGYDPATDRFPSTVYSSMVGVPIPYEYDVQGNQVTIRTDFNGGATYQGSFSEDGDSGSGGWRPDQGAGPGNVAYDLTVRRVR
jgi:Protein of unknown function (DUF1579)